MGGAGGPARASPPTARCDRTRATGREPSFRPPLSSLISLEDGQIHVSLAKADRGEPWPYRESLPYDCGFGVDANDPTQIDLTEPIELLSLLRKAGVAAVNLSAGSPYTVPHVTRPAAFPPSDGYPPPEDPLIGVWRQIEAAGRVKAAVPGLVLVGSGYTYLQEYVAHAAQAVVRRGMIDIVGLGRMVLSYPDLPADVLAGTTLTRNRVCRTFSDCTTAPRHGLRSGCYPLDEFYKRLEPEASHVKALRHP